MAAKRIAGTSVDWLAFGERVPPDQLKMFQAFRSKSEGYARKVQALPADPPKIDWARYAATVKEPVVVEGLRKQFEAIKVPYPADKLTSAVNSQEAEAEQTTKKFIEASNDQIKHMTEILERWNAMEPPENWTKEEFIDTFPKVYDPYHPYIPPNYPHDQVGYNERWLASEAAEKGIGAGEEPKKIA